jgi:hypothetical protein
VDRIILNTTEDGDSTEKVVLFDASEQPAVDNELDLVDLTKVHEMVAGAQVPAGDYGKIEIEISDPRLRLVGDPVGEYRTNLQLTANGRLFAQVELAMAEGQEFDLHLVLNRIHLVEKGNGDFVLTPQLRVEILPEA